MSKPNVNAYWDFVKSLYPDARFDFWYRNGELHFYPDGRAEERGDRVWGCVMDETGVFRILTPYDM